MNIKIYIHLLLTLHIINNFFNNSFILYYLFKSINLNFYRYFIVYEEKIY